MAKHVGTYDPTRDTFAPNKVAPKHVPSAIPAPVNESATVDAVQSILRPGSHTEGYKGEQR